MELKKEDFILGMWFAEKKDECNFQLIILKRDGKWIGEYRFRYYIDHKVFGSNDRRSSYTLTIPNTQTEEQIIQVGNFMLKELHDSQGFNPVEYVEIKGDAEKMLYRCGQTDWFHFKKINMKDKEEVAKFKEMYPGANIDDLEKGEGNDVLRKAKCGKTGSKRLG